MNNIEKEEEYMKPVKRVKIEDADQVRMKLTVKFDPRQPGISPEFELVKREDAILMDGNISTKDLMKVIEVIGLDVEIEEK